MPQPSTLPAVDTPLEIAPEDVVLEDWDHVVDIRPHATTAPRIPGSEAVDSGTLTSETSGVDRQSRVLVVCDVGMRSRIAALALKNAGATDVRSLEGGIDAWRRAGRQLTHTGGLPDDDLDRYDRQIKLPGFGSKAQVALRNSTVVVVGAGGLGSPVVAYLAGAGVGSLVIVDDDDVSVSNLHRQPLFRSSDAGQPKADLAVRFVESLNPSISAVAIHDRITPENAEKLIAGADLVVDASDNYPTRYTVNDASVRAGIPLVTGAVYRFEGQVLTVLPTGPCYRCVFPREATDSADLDCSIVGVLGPVVGTVGSMMATAAIRALTNPGSVNRDVLTVFDGLTLETMRVRSAKRESCPTCGGRGA